MPHQQLNELLQNEMEFESSFSSYTSASSSFLPLTRLSESFTNYINPHQQLFLLQSQALLSLPPSQSPRALFRCRRPCKLKRFAASHVYPRTWNRLKKLCLASIPAMATHLDSSFRIPLELKKKNNNTGLQNKGELEREVYVLNKMLAQEQKVHDYLEQVQHREQGSALSIPNFLPPKMKEIVTELAMVEDEITRLESQIKVLRDEVKHEKEGNMERKYTEWSHRAVKNNQEASTLPPHPNTISRRPNDKSTFDTKTLHFISKAMKGDYNISIQKENAFHDDEGGAGGGVFREKISKRNGGLVKTPSPLREPRHPTPARRDRYLDVPTDYSVKVMSTPLHTEEEIIQKWPPNKLSENIMKCMIFIYVRLLRTSRVMEMEKSGSIARSTNFSLSFRADSSTISNSKGSGLMVQKDSRQQDPYGIFNSEVSILRDIGPYKNLVRFTSTSMDLKCIKNSSSVPLFQKLKVLMDGLQKVDLRFLSHQQKLAFWINMYNACIMHGYLQYGVPSVLNNETLLALINKATLNIGGNTINARAIEHFILRKPEDSSISKEILGKEMMVGELYGLETPDPNIVFALCGGTRSSPAVKIYTAEGVTAELERSKLEYLQAAIMVSGGVAKKIGLPQLVLMNMRDFASDKESLMEWVCQQLPTSGSLRKSIVDCFRKGSYAVVEKIPYEFEFQYLLPIS